MSELKPKAKPSDPGYPANKDIGHSFQRMGGIFESSAINKARDQEEIDAQEPQV